ncbi:MAG TPA: cyclic nucleotide-binding domain-containing protein [Polyangiaceae bacterium]|nr:cyclic nucleotide-binding domain-containing protein [Polyangiaceae bacterium]
MFPPRSPAEGSPREAPLERAFALAAGHRTREALGWALAALRDEPASAGALFATGYLLAHEGHGAEARPVLDACSGRALDVSDLPLAVAACLARRALGDDVSSRLDVVARAFGADSTRLLPGLTHRPPPLPPTGPERPAGPAPAWQGGALAPEARRVIDRACLAFRAAEHDRGQPWPLAPQPLFSALPAAALRRLLGAFRVRLVAPGETVIRQGEAGEEVFIVARGDLEVSRRGPGPAGAAPVQLARLGAGSLVGEMALIARAPRVARVVARRPGVLLAARRSELAREDALGPEVGRALGQHARQRMVHNLVRLSPVLLAVPEGEREALIERFETRLFAPDELLTVEGEQPPGLHLIASGSVSVQRVEGPGERLVLAHLGVGDSVGEVALVLRRRATANVVALERTVTMFLPRASFRQLLDEYPPILVELYRLAVRREEATASAVAREVVPLGTGEYTSA